MLKQLYPQKGGLRYAGRTVGDVHMPDGIGSLGNKLLLQQMRSHWGIMVRLRGDFEVAVLFALDAYFLP